MHSDNRQLAINMLSSFVAFAVNLGITYLLTPFVVSQLGVEAYGFLGLATNIIGYTSLITIALNSMAGRFIAIKYQEGNVGEANIYFSSVFYSNVFLSVVVLIALGGLVIFAEQLFNIPSQFVLDVKALFALSGFATIVSLLTNVYGVATFIKNRLELSSIRQIIGNMLRAAMIVALFGLFPAHLWYYGLTGIVLMLYISGTNIGFTRKLTPDLHIDRRNWDWRHVKELLSAGVWNLISKLGDILGQGFDLVIANICIGTAEMGLFAITKSVPFLILSLYQMVAGVFAPIFTRLYAERKGEKLKSELLKSVRILCALTSVPLVCLYVYGDVFYGLWLPSEDNSRLQMLTIMGTFALPFTSSLESLWNIFTITNKLKYSTLFTLGNSIVVFLIVVTSMFLTQSHEIRLLVLASTRSICGVIRGLVFLPLYGAYCLGIPKGTFMGTICWSLTCMAACFALSFCMKLFFVPSSWIGLLCACLCVTGICMAISSWLLLTSNDRKFLLARLMHFFS